MNSKKMNRKMHDGNHELAKKPSKHDANLRKNNLLPFQIGLILSLLVVYFVLEVEVPDRQLAIVDPMDLGEPDVMITVPEFKVYEEMAKEVEPAKQSKRLTDTYTEIENDDPTKLITDIVDVDPPTTADPDFDVNSVPVIEEEPDVIIFDLVEEVPMFIKCEKVAKNDRRACFQEQMQKHIKRNFRYPELAQDLGQYGKVYVRFVINKEGDITNIQIKGPHKTLEKEAARIIGKLPKMIPGKQHGTPVNVPFSIPIYFQLQQ